MRVSDRFLATRLVAGLILCGFGWWVPTSLAAEAATVVLREDWRETPAALPMTQDHVATAGLVLGLHGPGVEGIKKSHHDQPADDPYYVWSGQCKMRWAVSLRPARYRMNLSAPDAKVRLRTKQAGGRELCLVIKLPDDWWYVSDQGVPGSEDWREFELAISELTWSRLNIITIQREEPAEGLSLENVEEIGFTDLEIGGASKACSRVDWIEVWGGRRDVPRPTAAAGKTLPVEPVAADRIVAHRDVVYARYGERELPMDLYRPRSQEGPLPAVVFIHGGGWYKGNRDSYTPMAEHLATRGYVTANIEYRLAGEAPFPAAIQDCKAAVRFLRAHADTYGIDPARIGCVGGSAGGHLAGLLATSADLARLEGEGGNRDQSSRVQAAVVMAGSMDLVSDQAIRTARADPRRRMITFMGGDFDVAGQNYRDASPILHVGPKTPPILMMDGQFDQPGERYVDFRPLLDKYGIESEFLMIEGAPHAYWSRNPFFDVALQHVTAFFDRTLRAR